MWNMWYNHLTIFQQYEKINKTFHLVFILDYIVYAVFDVFVRSNFVFQFLFFRVVTISQSHFYSFPFPFSLFFSRWHFAHFFAFLYKSLFMFQIVYFSIKNTKIFSSMQIKSTNTHACLLECEYIEFISIVYLFVRSFMQAFLFHQYCFSFFGNENIE